MLFQAKQSLPDFGKPIFKRNRVSRTSGSQFSSETESPELRETNIIFKNLLPNQFVMKRIFLLSLVMALASLLYAITAEQSARRDSLRDAVLTQISGAVFDAQQPVRSVLSFGARGNGTKDCKPAFDKAMKKAAQNPKGLHLVVPAGEYLLNGPIHLVSNVCLELQEGAVLKFSSEPSHYLPVVHTSWEGSFCYNYSPFIYGYQLQNVAIVGKGKIDGNATETFAIWRQEQDFSQQKLRQQDHAEVAVKERVFGAGHKLRPHLIQLYGCNGITLSDFFITNSPFWCVHLLQCENAVCRSLKYDAKLVNNDGIDPEMTRNLLIEDIDFDNGDDNVAIKAGRDNDGWLNPFPSENIVIRNCRFKGLHGVVIGSEMSAGVRNVFVENCESRGYCKRALYVKTNPNRGGFVRDIYFNNCRFEETEDLFYITSMYAGEGLDDHHFTDVGNIHVEHVSCGKVRNAAIVLQGTEAKPLHDISFEDVVVNRSQIGFSSTHTLDVSLKNCHLGGIVNSIPSQVSEKDKIFEESGK